MILYQPIIKATPEQLAICNPWRASVLIYAESERCEVEYAVEDRLGFTLPAAEKDYAIIKRMATTPRVLCVDWDIELLPGFEVGGDEIWVGQDHCSMVYNGADMLTFARILNAWDEYRASCPDVCRTWMYEATRGWKIINQFRAAHPEIKFNTIDPKTYIHHSGEVR
jgi:hypothetical protein